MPKVLVPKSGGFILKHPVVSEYEVPNFLGFQEWDFFGTPTHEFDSTKVNQRPIKSMMIDFSTVKQIR